MKRKNLIFDTGQNEDVDNYVLTLSEENYDPDIWLGLVERDYESFSYKKRKTIDIEAVKTNNPNKIDSSNISNAVARVVVPVVATVVIASLGLLPGLDGLNISNMFTFNQNSISTNLDDSSSKDFVFDWRILDSTQTIEVDNFAVTRKDNNFYVPQNIIAPGTSGGFVIEIDTTRNRNFSRI